MEILKPIYASLALLGIHILKPYHYLLMDPDTNYSTLIKAFPSLYKELKEISPSSMLTADQCFKFVPKELFNKAKQDKAMLDELLMFCQQYPNEIIQILEISLKKFAQGFAHQKGAIFDFGEQAKNNTGSILKIYALDEAKL